MELKTSLSDSSREILAAISGTDGEVPEDVIVHCPRLPPPELSVFLDDLFRGYQKDHRPPVTASDKALILVSPIMLFVFPLQIAMHVMAHGHYALGFLLAASEFVVLGMGCFWLYRRYLRPLAKYDQSAIMLSQMLSIYHGANLIPVVLDQLLPGRLAHRKHHLVPMLTAMLPYLREGDASHWTDEQMSTLLQCVRHPIPFPEFAIALAEASGRIGNRDLSKLVMGWRRLPREAVATYFKLESPNVYRETIRKIEEAAGLANSADTLLRSSGAPSCIPETLLRPANGNASKPYCDQLLLPAMPE